jgi:hypothetical protein
MVCRTPGTENGLMQQTRQFRIGQPVRPVEDALGELGIEHLDMPMTCEPSWRRIGEATTRRAA